MKPHAATLGNQLPADIGQQAMSALSHLSDDEKLKVLDYLKALLVVDHKDHGSKPKILAEGGRVR